MSFQNACGVLKSLRDAGTPNLGASIDVLERLAAGQADEPALNGVIERLSLMGRIAMAVAGQPGARGELERIARELEAKFVDLRLLQARRSFEVFGSALGVDSVDDYIKGTDALEGVMELPEFTEIYQTYFKETVLVDGRVFEGHEKSVGLSEVCRLVGLVYGGNDDTFVPFEPGRVRHGLYWVRFQDGRCNHNCKPTDCRDSFAPFEVGADAKEGVARYVQGRDVLSHHFMDLPGSVHAGDRDSVAVLGVWFGGPVLVWNWHDGASPVYGSASRGE